MNLHAKLSEIQVKLKAPKGQFNSFGKYKYRSCEDILESIKPLLNGLVLTISDDVVLIGERYYIKATSTLSDGENSISVQAFARESLDKKGMDDSQISGTASSYARKYSLNGLFCIDDTKDADDDSNHPDNNRSKVVKKEIKQEPVKEVPRQESKPEPVKEEPKQETQVEPERRRARRS